MAVDRYTELHLLWLFHQSRAKVYKRGIMHNWHKAKAKDLYMQMAELADLIPIEVLLTHIETDPK